MFSMMPAREHSLLEHLEDPFASIDKVKSWGCDDDGARQRPCLGKVIAASAGARRQVDDHDIEIAPGHSQSGMIRRYCRHGPRQLTACVGFQEEPMDMGDAIFNRRETWSLWGWVSPLKRPS